MTKDVHLGCTKGISSRERKIFLPPYRPSPLPPSLFSLRAVYFSGCFLRTESLLLTPADGDVAVAKWICAHYRVSLNVAQSSEGSRERERERERERPGCPFYLSIRLCRIYAEHV
jgi:hypothetical protein